VEYEYMNISIDGLVLDEGDSLTIQLRERLAAVLAPADLDAASRAVGDAVREHADRAVRTLPG
jgi:hypothetical protein